MDSLIHNLKSLTIDTTDCQSLTSKIDALTINSTYELDQTIDASQAAFITKIKLNFYQLWCMFGEVPCVYNCGKTGLIDLPFYEYKIRSPKAVFRIYAWREKNGFLNTSNWNIGSNTQDAVEIQNFLEHLFSAISFYSEHYKCIEKKIFRSDNPVVDQRLKGIRNELLQWRDVLSSM